MSADGQEVIRPDHFMPFGIGQRQCMGDQLAEKEYFLFFTSLLHTFQFELPEEAPLPDLRGVAGVTVTPKDFKVVFSPRNFEALAKSISADLSESMLPKIRTYG